MSHEDTKVAKRNTEPQRGTKSFPPWCLGGSHLSAGGNLRSSAILMSEECFS